MLRRCLFLLLLCVVTLTARLAAAGTISFGLSITGDIVTVTNQGSDSAYYPAVYRLLGDGSWQALALPRGATQPAELRPGASVNFAWPDNHPPASLPPLEAMRGIMVRFFDQAGASFGQISFFNQPANAGETVHARYENGLLSISPPESSTIRATWVLWPKEEGIAPLRHAVHIAHEQPPAKHIVWQNEKDKVRLDTGAGLPSVLLLHETPQGFALQYQNGGGLQGRQQRAAWLNANTAWRVTAALLAMAAMVLGVLEFRRARA